MRCAIILIGGVLTAAFAGCIEKEAVEGSESADPAVGEDLPPIDEAGETFLLVFEDADQPNVVRFDAARKLAERGYLPSIPAFIRNIDLWEYALTDDPETGIIFESEFNPCRACSCIGLLAQFGSAAIQLTVDACLSNRDPPEYCAIWCLAEALNSGKMREHMDQTCAYLVKKAGQSDDPSVRSNAITLFVHLKVKPTFTIPDDLKWRE